MPATLHVITVPESLRKCTLVGGSNRKRGPLRFEVMVVDCKSDDDVDDEDDEITTFPDEDDDDDCVSPLIA